MSLAYERAARGLTLEQTAVALGLSAKSRGWISEIERGLTDASLRLALRIEKWSEGRVAAASVCRELADHVELPSEPSPSALANPGSSQEDGEVHTIERAYGGDPVVSPVAGDAANAASERDSDESIASLPPAAFVQLGRAEVSNANLDPSGPADASDRLDAQAVAVSDVDDFATEDGSPRGLGRGRSPVGDAGAGIGDGRASGDESERGGQNENAEHGGGVARMAASSVDDAPSVAPPEVRGAEKSEENVSRTEVSA